jgi:phosphoenolpyruvate synthase/pyruvate phosphate dikinase
MVNVVCCWCWKITYDYYKNRTMTVNGKTNKEGDWISLNGSTGQVLEGIK